MHPSQTTHRNSHQTHTYYHRCLRLKKDCQPAPRARASKPKHRIDKHSALEAKVDGIVEILKRTQAIPDLPDSFEQSKTPGPSIRPQRCGPALAATPLYQLSIQAGNQEKVPLSQTASRPEHSKSGFTLDNNLRSRRDSSSPPLHHPGRPKDGAPVMGAFGNLLKAASDATDKRSSSSSSGTAAVSNASSHTYSTPASSVDDALSETREELQGILDTYRNIMCQFSPIVLISPDVTIDQMAAERPSLWLVIQMICTKKLARQLALGEEVNRVIAQKTMIEGERTFDMLCALIVHVNWGQFSCVKANLGPPLHLAHNLAGALGLLKPAPQTSPAVMMNISQAGCPQPPYALNPKPRTLDERRIAVGLFYVSSICANFFQRTEPMRWSHYLEECLQVLMDTKDRPSDELLAILVRIQIVANALQADGWNETYPLTSSSQRPPRSHMTHLHKMQLDDLKRTIPTHLRDNPMLRYHLLGVEISLHEHLLQAPPNPPTAITDQTRYIEGLWACLTTIKSYTDSFFAIKEDEIPLSSYVYLPISVYTHLGHCMVALFRLSTFEAPGIPWDRQYIVSTLDLGDVVRQWIHIMDASPKAARIDVSGANGQESQWEYSKKILQPTILKWWETKVRPSIMGTQHVNELQATQGMAQNQTQNAPLMETPFEASMADTNFGDVDFNFDTEMWMRDMFSSGFDFTNW